MKWSIYIDKKTTEIVTLEELISQIEEIKNNYGDQKPIITLNDPNKNELTIGISNEYCFIQYVDKSLDPPYYISVGNNKLKKHYSFIVFYIDNNYTEIPLRNCINYNLLKDIIIYYFKTNKLSKKIEWEIV